MCREVRSGDALQEHSSEVGIVWAKSIRNSGQPSTLQLAAATFPGQVSTCVVAKHEPVRRKHGGARGID